MQPVERSWVLKTKAIIVDLDGTLANSGHRVRYVDGSQKKDWDKFNALSAYDPIHEWCLEIVNQFNRAGYKIIFLTARSDSQSTRKITETWLSTHVGPGVDYELIMRAGDDFRTDYITKRDLFQQHVMPKYDVLFAIDDKLAVCNMWRDMGITALHCEEY
jgi:predicted secreted acid phosphatase